MKIRLFIIGIACCIFSLTASAQQLGGGRTPDLDSYNTNIPSGFYSTHVKQEGFPSYNSAPYAENRTYLINVSRNDPTYQWQIATPWGADDRMFFRKIYPITGGLETPWYELATRGENVFTKNQYLTSHDAWGTSPIGTKNPRFYFGGITDNSDGIYFTRYNVAENKSELRLSLGDDWNSHDDKFVIGADVWYAHLNKNVYESKFVVTAGGWVGINTTTPQNALDVNGTIRAKEIIVETFGADFVFEKDYNLRSLSEVKSHIDEHKHLPEIPSAAQMQENGVGMSELSIKLLQKVEELTLYAIQQNDKVAEQQKLIEQLNKRLEELENDKK